MKLIENTLKDPIPLARLLFSVLVVTVFIFASLNYQGNILYYLFFSIISNTLLFSAFRPKALFFDVFIAIFFWLGFWLKLSIRVAFMEGEFHESIGNFDGSGESFDRSLLISSTALSAILLASYIREKIRFSYSPSKNITNYPLQRLYTKYRTFFLLSFLVAVLLVATTNFYLGVYQKGMVTQTELPYGLSGIYKWLLLFGFSSITTFFLHFEYLQKKRTTYLVAILGLLETFINNVSMLSRGMVLNTSAIVYGVYKSLSLHSIKSSYRFLVTCFLIFLVLFGLSVVLVNYKRASIYSSDIKAVSTKTVARTTKVLFLDRWVGIEGVMAISSYPKLDWQLWSEAWQEKYSQEKTSFYDNRFIDTPYKGVDSSKNHFISLPGIVAFCFYPGSYLFLFICIFGLALGAAFFEYLAFKLAGGNVIFCALIAQVIAYRFASFGYVPGQSYLLFGSILLTIGLIWMSNHIVGRWLRLQG